MSEPFYYHLALVLNDFINSIEKQKFSGYQPKSIFGCQLQFAYTNDREKLGG